MNTTVTAAISHLCPYVDEVDHGTITLVFEGPAPELHGLRKYIDSFHSRRISHEELTQQISRQFGAHVTTTWTTAGLDLVVECMP